VKKLYLACSGAFLLAAACAQSGPGSTPGTAGSSGGDSSGTAGTTGAGGTTGTGGADNPGTGGSTNPGTAGDNNPGTAGSNPGTAGSNPGTAGSNPGTAGSNPGTAGSNPGTAGTTAGSGGSAGSAGTTGNGGRGGTTGAGGTAGTTGGRGGTTGAGGTAGTTGGRGGTTGTGGSGGTGGAACPTIAELVPGLDGYLWQVLPTGNTPLSGTNYPFGDPSGASCTQNTNWNLAGYIKQETPLAVKGTAGQKYTINIGVRGVVGTRCYTGGVPGSTAAGNPGGQNNTWYAGGAQFNNSIWNTMEVRVAPKVAGQPNQTTNTGYDIYFTNSFQNANSFCEKEATYETRFNASFPVMGQGSITFAVHDSNCRTLANCGQVESQMTCNTGAARIIDMSGVTPAAMNPGGGTFSQPRTGVASNGMTYTIQWIWIDVTSVTCN
jgi:hypothetical protein